MYNWHFRRQLGVKEHLRPTSMAEQSVRFDKAVVMGGDGDTALRTIRSSNCDCFLTIGSQGQDPKTVQCDQKDGLGNKPRLFYYFG